LDWKANEKSAVTLSLEVKQTFVWSLFATNSFPFLGAHWIITEQSRRHGNRSPASLKYDGGHWRDIFIRMTEKAT
jgi:hypothetical protein